VSTKKAIFIFNLLQDVNILRPLILLAGRELSLPTEIIVTDGFVKRDLDKSWYKEIQELVSQSCSLVFWAVDEYETYKVLEGKAGIIFAASESSLSAHTPTHNIFKIAPKGFVKVTLQHGFECVGFLQSVQHIIAHGENITFGADVVCGWSEVECLTSMAASQKDKLLVTGPTAVIQQPPRLPPKNYGMICENLHSVRLSASGDLKADFMEMFASYCKYLAKKGLKVALRPHPGGQYVLKNNVKLAPNVEVVNGPIYKVDLSQFAYGVSAPSSVIIDMILADIPVAVWRDNSGIMDTDNYFGLAQVSSVEDLQEFADQAVKNPQKYLDRQRSFLARSGLKTEPKFVFQQFKNLIESTTKNHYRSITNAEVHSNCHERVMYVANDYIPTLQLSFIKPLAESVENGELIYDLITEKEMRDLFSKAADGASACRYLQAKLENFKPSVIVFCRYSGPNTIFIRLWAKQYNVPVIFHIDDDLMHVPISLGESKFQMHNSPARTKAVRFLLDNSDLVYCSTLPLAQRFRELGVNNNIEVAGFYCSGSIIVPAELRQVRKIGYMGFDHAHDLDTMVAAIASTLEKNQQIVFEMFGTVPKPKLLEKFGSRIIMKEPVRDYALFLKEFAELGWDIGICPLANDSFNKLKANTKWVEYSSIGAAVIATSETVYDECISENCGLLVTTVDEWKQELDRLINSPELRYELVKNAQRKIEQSFSVEHLQNQVLRVFEIAKNKAG
jgi:glycosyltransferase involved in cell wall biosynthesis